MKPVGQPVIFMDKIHTLFFELIRVALGNADSLSRMPNGKEWQLLFDIANKQSLIGICFAGIQRLGADADEGFARVGLSEMLYFTWMGLAYKIQMRNEQVNRQCAEVEKRLSDAGFRSTIMKGQTLMPYYAQHLHGLRQSGDIDVWMDSTRERTLRYVNDVCPTDDDGELHVGLHIFKDTEVEIHFTPSIASGKRTNKRLQQWFEGLKEECLSNKVILSSDNIEIITPTMEFNMVFLLHHIFRHYLYEGIGLRQILDYYFVLQHSTKSQREEAMRVFKELRMDKFAGALMWVMTNVFVNPDSDASWLLCVPDESLGRRLLEVIEEGGNFGHATEKYKVTGWDKPWSRLSRYARRNWYMLQDYPDEIISNLLKKFKLG